MIISSHLVLCGILCPIRVCVLVHFIFVLSRAEKKKYALDYVSGSGEMSSSSRKLLGWCKSNCGFALLNFPT